MVHGWSGSDMTAGTERTTTNCGCQVVQFHADDQDLVQSVDVDVPLATCAPDVDAFDISCQDLWITIV